MSSGRPPRYVPSHSRRVKNQRFHGAFTGGFSAGFYNTVGSKEGWTPKSNHEDEAEELPSSSMDDEGNIVAQDYPSSRKRPRSRPQQKLEDFMDEQDHDEWGGPTSLRREYEGPARKGQPSAGTTQSSASTATDNIADWMKVATVVPPANVGNRLLRALGWREGNSAAYVPSDSGTAKDNHHQSTLDSSTQLLSKKRLRKVQLQQQRVKIPPPKLNTCGLGFEPYQNAPEFRAHQEKRRKQAQQRAQLKTSNNVYRVSNVLGNTNDDDDDGNDGQTRPPFKRNKNEDDDDAYVSYETMEEFVGTKSVGGFALREDEDDAYDDDQPFSLTKVSDKVRLDAEEYNTEIYEHHSSDEDDNPGNSNNRPGSSAGKSRNDDRLAGILSSFADTGTASSSPTQNKKAASFTTDGRPPLVGFVMGGAFASHSLPKRYRGPDIPSDYEVKPKEFGPNEHPSVLRALSHAVQLEVVDEKRRQAMDEALSVNAASNRPAKQRLQTVTNSAPPPQPASRSSAPMAGGAFAGLAQAMKSRFTSSAKEGSDAGEAKPQAGLRLPSKEPRNATISNEATEARQNDSTEVPAGEIKITRTVHPFVPHLLLCKRFYVPVPASSHQGASVPGGRVTEAKYFQQEILNPATKNNPQASQKKTENAPKPARGPASAGLFEEDGTMKDDALGGGPREAGADKEERPSMDTYKSIFEPESDKEEEDDASDTDLDASDLDDETKNNERDVVSDSNAKASQQRNARNYNLDTEEKKVDPKNKPTNDIQSNERVTEDEGAIAPHSKHDKNRKKKKHKSKGRSSRDRQSGRDESDEEPRRKRSRSVSSESTDLSRDSSSDRRDRKRRRERKEKKKKKHKHKSKKKSKRK